MTFLKLFFSLLFELIFQNIFSLSLLQGQQPLNLNFLFQKHEPKLNLGFLIYEMVHQFLQFINQIKICAKI